MTRLRSMDEIAFITNPVHREVLTTIRDTSLSVREIAGQMKITTTSIYSIVRKYLPDGYLKIRKQIQQTYVKKKVVKKKASPDDPVIVIPQQPIPSDRTGTAHNAPKAIPYERVSFRNEKMQKQDSAIRSSSSEIPESRSKFTLTCGEFSLQWECENIPHQLEAVLGIIKKLHGDQNDQ